MAFMPVKRVPLEDSRALCRVWFSYIHHFIHKILPVYVTDVRCDDDRVAQHNEDYYMD